jgi:hypothetical protein
MKERRSVGLRREKVERKREKERRRKNWRRNRFLVLWGSEKRTGQNRTGEGGESD